MAGDDGERRAQPPKPPAIGADLAPFTGPEIADESRLRDAAITTDIVVPQHLGDLTIERSTLSGVGFTGVTIERLDLVDCRFDRCEVSGAMISGVTADRVTFDQCRMSGLTAADSTLNDLVFTGCRMDGSWFRMATMERCVFVDCDLTDADFYAAKLSRCTFIDCVLDTTEWSKSILDDVGMTGCTVEGIRGAASLRNLVLGSAQLHLLAAPILHSVNVVVDDDYFASPN